MVTALPLLLFMLPACDFGKPAGDETAPPLDTAAPAPVDDDGDGWSEPEDCDDTDPEVHPQAAEVCNGKDDDCDGTVDVAAVGAGTWYPDVDADGYGDPDASVIACDAPTGFIADGRDCDDADPAQHPGADEHCNGEDDDCDSDIDEEATDAATWYADRDSDGYGDPASDLEACTAPATYVADATDCDDRDIGVHPGAGEVCDGQDDDCDGEIDEGVTMSFFGDEDGDGFGNPETPLEACAAPTGFVADASDCDDADPRSYPGADERCDGADNDCDHDVDEDDAVDASTWYADADGDGFGDPGTTALACAAPTGYLADATDCDDADPDRNPAAAERCDGLDDDCDGDVDEDLIETWYADSDGDGYGDSASAMTTCDPPSGWVSDATDCDDGDAAVSPAAKESCNGVDDDCNGSVDDGVLSTWYTDGDGDGYGDATSATTACTAPSGTVSDDTDCDDASMTTHPGAEEICGDGLDNDCDGLVDEGDTAAPEDTGPGGDTGAPCAGATACPSDMVLVGSCFCIDVYEASRPDATATSAGIDSSCAVSQAGVRPWQVSSNADAATACAAAGKRLCSEAEWYEACAGPTDTDYTYGDAYDAAACNGLDTHCTCADGSVYEDCFFDCGGSFYLLPTGSLSACTNGWGVYDMSGNLWEHVDGGNDSTVRGGAYNCGDTPSYHRCSYIPTTWTPSARGFRCCSDGI
ncbi:MAG: MopE-related protein [Pseudomonadota bacterium]